ncbi:hypothetical protein PTKIN_Ptkin10aG0173100 [Pterospermum kingtungense]
MINLWRLCFSFSKPSVNEIREQLPWDKLPGEIWSLIFQRLQLVDRLNASLACKEWNSTLKQTVQPVWMLLFSDFIRKDSDYVTYFDLSEGTLGKIISPKSVAGKETCVFGASKGWFALTKEMENNLQLLFLFDPISEIRILLPPVSTMTMHGEIKISSKDASQSVVAATFDEGKTLALCRPEDNKWTVFEGLGDKYRFSRILFCDGILYALVDTLVEEDSSLQFQTHYMKLVGGDDDDDVILKLIPSEGFLDIGPPFILGHPIEEVDLFADNCLAIPYMVESNGELLVVVKILGVSIVEDDSSTDQTDSSDETDADDLSPSLLSYFRVERFEVFKVEASDTLAVTRLSTLDDRTLFIDGVDSLSITAGENFSKNCIYFLEDGFEYNSDWRVEPIMISRESGVFHLDDGRIERSFPSLDVIKRDRNLWFFPNLKIGSLD